MLKQIWDFFYFDKSVVMAVAPLVVAGIMAAAKLFGDLAGNAAKKKQQQDELTYKGIQEGLDTQMQAAQNLSQGQQAGLEGIIDGYRQILQRRPM